MGMDVTCLVQKILRLGLMGGKEKLAGMLNACGSNPRKALALGNRTVRKSTSRIVRRIL